MLTLTPIIYFLLTIFNPSLGLKYSDGHVAQLTETDFDEFTSLSSISIVNFYGGKCDDCEKLAPQFFQSLHVLDGIVGFGEVDCENHHELCSKYKIDAHPSLLLFREGKKKPKLYDSTLDAKSIVEFCLKHLKEIIKDRSKKVGIKLEISPIPEEGSGKKHGGESCSSGGSSRSESWRGGSSGSESSSAGSAVIDLTDDNFGRLVLESDNDWLISFYAPWCPHCKSLKPEWEVAAKKLKGKMKLGAVDATIYQGLAQRYSIQGFPTIKYFPAGAKTGAPDNYDGGRSADAIVAWATEIATKNKPPPELKEITGPSILRDGCTDRQLCIITVLPDLLDCQSKCRNDYLSLLKSSAEKFKQNDWGWVWTSAAKHVDLEDTLNIGGFGYPALVALNSRKRKCAIMHGSFSSNGLNEFFRELSLGRGSVPLIPIADLPDVSVVEAWDGKDIPYPLDEEEEDVESMDNSQKKFEL